MKGWWRVIRCDLKEASAYSSLKETQENVKEAND